MLYDLVKQEGRKKDVVMTDTMGKIRNRKKQLQASDKHHKNISYEIVPSVTNHKFKKKPHNPRIGGGDAQTPRLTKWD
jgi:hypothetical protein